MAKAFTALKDPRVGLLDKLTFGKFKDCRVCDILDQYDYLIWAERQGFVKYSKEAIAAIQEAANFAAWETYQTEEITPWYEDVPH